MINPAVRAVPKPPPRSAPMLVSGLKIRDTPPAANAANANTPTGQQNLTFPAARAKHIVSRVIPLSSGMPVTAEVQAESRQARALIHAPPVEPLELCTRRFGARSSGTGPSPAELM